MVTVIPFRTGEPIDPAKLGEFEAFLEEHANDADTELPREFWGEGSIVPNAWREFCRVVGRPYIVMELHDDGRASLSILDSDITEELRFDIEALLADAALVVDGQAAVLRDGDCLCVSVSSRDAALELAGSVLAMIERDRTLPVKAIAEFIERARQKRRPEPGGRSWCCPVSSLDSGRESYHHPV